MYLKLFFQGEEVLNPLHYDYTQLTEAQIKWNEYSNTGFRPVLVSYCDNGNLHRVILHHDMSKELMQEI